MTLVDTAGSEKYKSVQKNFYRDKDGVLLVYDITDLSTFENIKGWLNDVEDSGDAAICKMLVGNKLDKFTPTGDEEFK